MSRSSKTSWSDNVYAPKVPYREYFAEKANFAGVVIGAISYGIVVVLFFRCMGSLLDPVNRRMGGIKWPLVIHTLVIFSFVTVFTTQSLLLESDSYVDNRDFPGDNLFLPGPFAYQATLYTAAISLIPTVMIYVNTWLADGLLLYRCYVVYPKNNWVIVLPFMMYLASVAMGTGYIYQIVQLGGNPSTFTILFDFGTPFYSISLSLCVLLTLMIVGRLILHSRNIRNAMGSLAGAGGIYKAVSTMLIESYALYVVNFILFIGSWGASSSLQYCFFPILAEAQAIAPFLVVIRVANHAVLTNDVIVSGNVGSIHFKSHGESADYTETLPPESSTETSAGESPDELGVKAGGDIDEVPLKS